MLTSNILNIQFRFLYFAQFLTFNQGWQNAQTPFVCCVIGLIPWTAKCPNCLTETIATGRNFAMLLMSSSCQLAIVSLCSPLPHLTLITLPTRHIIFRPSSRADRSLSKQQQQHISATTCDMLRWTRLHASITNQTLHSICTAYIQNLLYSTNRITHSNFFCFPFFNQPWDSHAYRPPF